MDGNGSRANGPSLPDFEPSTIEDAREFVDRSIAARRGQPEFRAMLLEAYSGRCCITGCNAVEALEAAHIIKFMGPATDHIQNGLLLRADIHTLFDRSLIAVDPASWEVVLHPSLLLTTYAELHASKLDLPRDERKRPSVEALNEQRRQAGL